ncbi:restriction endonuclease subunit S [Streptococcus alactolyticus]|uniref:restriction endonuclease subunit S n=1 Tax=Streptococcus alactolyticus TaxID=29389 RepID=UPI003D02322F
MDSKIPNIRFKGFTDAWEQRRLGEVTIYQNGKGYEDSQSSSGKFELINLNSISIDGGLKSSGKYIESADKTLLTDDLVMVLSDVGKGDLLGRVAIIPKDNYYVLNQRVALIRPKNKQQTNYLFSYINSHQRYFKLHGAGMSQLNISKGSVENFPLLLPSLPEQQQIGTFFAHLDTLISLHQRKCDQTKELKKTMLQKMFPKKGETVPEIRFPEFTDAWEQRKLNEVSDIYDGTHQTPKYQDNGVMFLSVENIKTLTSNKFISREAFEDEFKIRPQRGDVLMTRIGDIGTANVVETDEDLAYYVSLALFKSEELNPYFLQASIYSPFVQDQIWKRTLHIAFPKKINKNEIGQVPINVPTLAEQTKIGSFFKQLDNTITLHQRKCDELKEIKKTLLKNLFI